MSPTYIKPENVSIQAHELSGRITLFFMLRSGQPNSQGHGPASLNELTSPPLSVPNYQIMSKNVSSAMLLALFILVSGCATTPGMIRDLQTLPQDAGAYHGKNPDKPLIGAGTQAVLFADFLRHHFSPWTRERNTLTADQVFWALDRFQKKHLFGQNTLERGPEWLKRMRTLSRVSAYPSLDRACIAVVNTSMRALPTQEPAFYDFTMAGEGYPFDYVQNSLVLAGTPLRAMHMSADKAWVLVQSRFAFGWVPVRNIGWADETFCKRFNAPAMVAMTRDRVSIADQDGRFCCMGEVGTILPLAERPDRNGFSVLVPLRDAHGNAMLTTARISRNDAALMPFAPTPAMFAKIANTMMGRPYGWGGLYGDRDCSATTMDLLSGFGIYLPRNSNQQYEAGLHTDLGSLGRDAKKQAIMDNAIPFLTLIRSPGHIMLYIGTRDGSPVIMHSMWGVKTLVFGKSGRHVVGRTVITTLEPGMELWNAADMSANPLDHVYGMRILNASPKTDK